MSLNTKGDPITDLYEDIAAEEKARATYQWIIDMSDDPDLNDALKFLREREIVHSQRFREAVEILKEDRGKKKYF
jgi:spore coat protein JC